MNIFNLIQKLAKIFRKKIFYYQKNHWTLPDLHLEITSKCVLACPGCPRTIYPKDYAVTDLPVNIVEKIVADGRQYKMITLCGDHGDPIYHSQFHEIISLLLKLPGTPYISIATNGSSRSEAWWAKTAQLLRKNDEIIFGIDGLEDTSHLYRKKNNWASIIKAIEILKSKGCCQITWQWILFRFNEHQLAEAATVAKKLKIDCFMIIGSSRFDDDDPFRPTLSIQDAENQFRKSYDISPV